MIVDRIESMKLENTPDRYNQGWNGAVKLITEMIKEHLLDFSEKQLVKNALRMYLNTVDSDTDREIAGKILKKLEL